MKTVWSILILMTLSSPIKAQSIIELDSLKTLELVDSFLIDRDMNNWSFRLFTNLKEQRVIYSFGASKVALIPNNPFGVGFGIATKKLILDIGFNIKPGKEQTDRFDLQAHFIPRNHRIGFTFQNYKGFTIKNTESGSTSFREDISLQSSGIRYLYMFKPNEFSFSSLKTGLTQQEKSTHSFGAGGFMLQIKQIADSTFVDNTSENAFNNQAFIVNSSSVAIGGSIGFSALIALPRNFFIGLGCNTGLGLSYSVVETENDRYIPSNPLVYQLGLLTNIGFSGEKVYVNLSIVNNLYGSDLDFGNRGLYNRVNAKLAIGFKNGRNKNL